MRASGAAAASTADKVLDIAERLVQTRGFNGFSYADISAALGITKASLHYHFPSKAALGRALVMRYQQRFLGALADIQRSSADARVRLRRYVELYTGVLRKKRMCLCGMLAAEHATLPKAIGDELKSFFDANERWLTDVMEQGRVAKVLRGAGSPAQAARMMLGALEGAMLIARSYGDVSRFESAAELLLSELGVTAAT